MKSLLLFALLLTPATQVPCQTSGCPVGSTVVTIGTANVRATCSISGTILKSEPAGTQGIVTSGPVPTSSGFDYIGVKFTDGVTGCVGDDNTTLVSTPPPPIVNPTITVQIVASGTTTTLTCTWNGAKYVCQ